MSLDLAAPLEAQTLLFLDLETTGLERAAGHRICEVALLRERAGCEEGRFESLVAPGRLLDPRAAAVNGLNDQQLAVAPALPGLAPAIRDLAHDAVLIGHNLAFDLSFLRGELGETVFSPLHGPSLDTLILARRLLRRRSYSLAALAAELGAPAPTHRAMADVLATRALFRFLCAQLAERGLITLADVLRFERGLLPGMPEPVAPAPFEQALREGLAVRIVYRSRTLPDAHERVVRPYALSLEAQGLFVRAFCELRQELRTFALAKIELAELVEPPTTLASAIYAASAAPVT
ncbi:MAG: exonuclease domain-containing protein [Oscillochloridaceae bacterium umkhey_bin13]